MSKKLTRRFYRSETTQVARDLLGQRLVHTVNGKRLSGTIVETEAYLGLQDPACHSFHGKVTARTKTFYLDGGHSYVYLIYGMYYCFNVITQKTNQPEAVLIRALEPIEGLEQMKKNRPQAKNIKSLCNGPGKLCQALNISMSENEIDLLHSSKIFIEKRASLQNSEITSRPRIGIDSKGVAATWPLRFYIKNNSFISKP